jgi:hypothetical protein
MLERSPRGLEGRLGGLLAAAIAWVALGCGGDASDGSEPPALAPEGSAAPVSIRPRPPARSEAAEPEPLAPEPASGVPAEVEAIISDPPAELAVEQVDILLGYYCVQCHATPACAAACDGLFFDSWADVAAGGNGGAANADAVLNRVVTALSDGYMPPAATGTAYDLSNDLPDAARASMVEFIRDVIDRRP